MFLDCICGSTTGGLGLLGLYINEYNVALINQTLETLTEYCQGPCHDNQNCIATHESNGLDIITALILNDINPLGKTRMDLVLELKNNASKLLLAIMESRGDSENAERILYNMNPKQLVDVACTAFHQESLDDDVDADDSSSDGDEGVSPKEVCISCIVKLCVMGTDALFFRWAITFTYCVINWHSTTRNWQLCLSRRAQLIRRPKRHCNITPLTQLKLK